MGSVSTLIGSDYVCAGALQIGELSSGTGKLFAGMMRSGILGAALLGTAALPAYAESDITLSGNAAFLTQYVDRGITNSAERPAVQAEFDLTYKEIYYASIWASNVDFGAGPNGQELASIEIDYYVGITPTLGKWNFDIAAYYVAYPGAFDPDGEFDYVEIWTGVDRSFFNDKLKLTIYNYWSPEYFGETGNNDVLELSYEWTFNKVWLFHTETRRQTRPSMGRSEPGRLRLYLLECRLDARLQ